MYKIIKQEENQLETVIEKSGLTAEFTIQQILDHLEYTEKVLKETNAQIKAEDIQNELAESIIPMLKELPEDKWNLVLMYANRKVQRPVSLSLVETSEKTIKSYKEQLEVIKQELGIDYEAKEVSQETEEVKENE